MMKYSMNGIEWPSVFISFELSLVTTIILLIFCVPMAWFFSTNKFFLKRVLESIFTLPLVLPPTVIGFYLLILMNPKTYLSRLWFSFTGQNLIFNFSGLVIGSVIYSLPLVLKPIQNAFENMDNKLAEVALTLRCTPRYIFWHLYLPLSRNSIITAAILGFSHTMGEFGVVLMLGGNIPDKTRTVSISIYDSVESLNYAAANKTALLMLVLSFVFLFGMSFFNKSTKI